MHHSHRKTAIAKPFYVVLHNIRSAFNVGSVFRTSDALGVAKIFLGGYTPRPDTHVGIAKTALGAEQYVPWESRWRTDLILDQLRADKVHLVALELTPKSLPLHTVSPRFPMALLLGNEVTGLSARMLSRTDEVVQIPMSGAKESLNVSVAFGIAAYWMLHG